MVREGMKGDEMRSDAAVGRLRCVARLALPALLVVGLPGLAPAQAQPDRARVNATRENFRREPKGKVLARVFRGAEFPVVDQRPNWAEVYLEGWIWAPSVAESRREGFDLVVTADGGENLRAEPQGAIRAKVLEGFLMERLGRRGKWYHVRRRGWLWKPSLALESTAARTTLAATDTTPGAAGGAAPNAATAGGSRSDTSSLLTAPRSVIVQANPDGDTVAVLQPGAQAQVLGRTGDWIRVRLDGWVYGPAVSESATDLADTGGLAPAQLRADPARYKGALVRWRVQFIALRRAEPGRSDFEEGEPFLLARAVGDEGFVYLAIPGTLLAAAQQLRPLQYVTVVGRVRTGRSSLLGSPVVDLTDIEAEPPTP